MDSFRYCMTHDHGFQTRTGSGDLTGLTGNRTEIRFFKNRELGMPVNFLNLHEPGSPTPVQACLLNKKKNQKMCLPSLEPGMVKDAAGA